MAQEMRRLYCTDAVREASSYPTTLLNVIPISSTYTYCCGTCENDCRSMKYWLRGISLGMARPIGMHEPLGAAASFNVETPRAWDTIR